MKYKITISLIVVFQLWFSVFMKSQSTCSPVLISDGTNTLCEDDPLTLSVSLSLPNGCSFDGPLPFKLDGPTPTSTSYNVFKVSKSAPGDYRARVLLKGTNCPCSNEPSNIIKVNMRPKMPDVTQKSVCPGESAQLEAISKSGNSGSLFYWYDSNNSTANLLFIGQKFNTPPLFSNTNYYVSEVVNGCESDKKLYPVNVNPTNKPSVVSNKYKTCVGANVILTAISGGGDNKFEWFEDPTGTKLLFLGAKYTTNSLTMLSNKFYVRELQGACKTGLMEIEIRTDTVISKPDLPAYKSVCKGNSTTITANAPGTIKWFNNPACTNQVFTGNTYKITNVQDKQVLYLKNYEGVCISSSSFIEIRPDSVIEPPTVNTSFTMCENGELSINAFAPGTIKWFDDKNTTNQIFIGSTLTLSSLKSSTSIYLQNNESGCISQTKEVKIQVNNTPLSPAVQSVVEVCYGDKAKILVTGNRPNNEIRLYTSASDVSYFTSQKLQQVNLSIIFEIEPRFTNYFVSEYNPDSKCESQRMIVSIIKHNEVKPPENNQTGVSRCSKDTLTLFSKSKNITEGDIRWYNGKDTAFLFTGNIYSVPGAFMQKAGNYSFFITEQYDGCESKFEKIAFTIESTPEKPELGNQISLCEAGTLVIKADVKNKNYIYHWILPSRKDSLSNFDSLKIANVNPIKHGGYYSLFLENKSGTNCKSIPDTVSVEIKNLPPAPIINSNSPVCEGNKIVFYSTSIKDGNYVWTYPNKKEIISISDTFAILNPSIADSGIYKVKTVVRGCYSQPTQILGVVKSKIKSLIIPSSLSECEGDTLSVSAPVYNNVIYLWEKHLVNNLYKAVLSSPVLLFSKIQKSDSGSYRLKIIKDNCESYPSNQLNIKVKPKPAQPEASSNSPICEGEILILKTKNQPKVNYLWYNPDSKTVNGTINNIKYTNSGLYKVISELDGCVSMPSYTEVIIYPKPVAKIISMPVSNNDSITINQGDKIQFSAQGGSTYLWEPETYLSNRNGAFLTAQPTSDITYRVIVSNTFNCSDSASINVTVIKDINLNIYNVLSLEVPENGKNDEWYIDNIENLGDDAEYYIKVFSESGLLVFETTKYDNSNRWNGYYMNNKSKHLPSGTYYYWIKITKPFDKIYKGPISIFRRE